MVTTEPPRSFKFSDIDCIYDSNGCNLLYEEDYMKFPAVINAPDGFTYVREKPSTKSKVKTKIRKNQIFLYTPIGGGEVIGVGLILTMEVYLSDIYTVNEYCHLINALWILKRK